MPRQRGPIAIYGATGYTGRLVAAELAAAQADIILSGRNRTKLEALCEALGRRAAVQPAALDDPDSLRRALEGCSAVIDCAGPFVKYGEPVVRAAIESKTHYLDTTGEQPYIKMLFERYGAEAERAGVALIPAMGFDYVPGDMLAALTAKGMGELDELLLAYAAFGFQPTRGTALTTIEMLRGGDVEWREGEWRAAPQSWGRGSFEFPSPVGRQRMIRYPAGEQITVPQHVRTRRVRTILTAATASPHRRLARAAQVLARPTGLAMRTPIKRAAALLIDRLPEGPDEDERRGARFMIVCEARKGDQLRRGVVSGHDAYGLTAAAIAQGALAASGRFKGRGALAPSMAFDPDEFLEGLRRFDLAWGVSPLGEHPAVPA